MGTDQASIGAAFVGDRLNAGGVRIAEKADQGGEFEIKSWFLKTDFESIQKAFCGFLSLVFYWIRIEGDRIRSAPSIDAAPFHRLCIRRTALDLCRSSFLVASFGLG